MSSAVSRCRELASEMERWHNGELSHRNEYLKHYNEQSHREGNNTSIPELEAMIAVADAQEVVKRSHMIQALLAMDRPAL